MTQSVIETGGEIPATWENRDEVAALPRVMTAVVLHEMTILTEEALYVTWLVWSLEPEDDAPPRSETTTSVTADLLFGLADAAGLRWRPLGHALRGLFGIVLLPFVPFQEIGHLILSLIHI